MSQVKLELENGVNLVKQDLSLGMVRISEMMKQSQESETLKFLEMNKKDEEITNLKIEFSTLEQTLALESKNLKQQIANLSVNTEALQLCHFTELNSLQVLLKNNEMESKNVFNLNNDLKISLKSMQVEFDKAKERAEELQLNLVKITLLNDSTVENHEFEMRKKNEMLIENQKMKENKEQNRKDFSLISEQLVQSNKRYDTLLSANILKENFLGKEIHLKEEAIRKELSLKEKSLKGDLETSNSHKLEINSRLMSIQDKVKVIESDHKIVVKDLQEKLQESEANCNVFRNQKLQIMDRNDELNGRINDLILNNQEGKMQIDKQKNDSFVLEKNTNNQMLKISNELIICKKQISELESSRDALRMDVTALEDSKKLLSKKIQEKDVNLHKISEEKDVLQSLLDKCNTLQNNNESKDLKKSLILAQHTASEREIEVFSLKETIRMECEERIEKMMEIDFLKEKIMRYDELRNNRDYNDRNFDTEDGLHNNIHRGQELNSSSLNYESRENSRNDRSEVKNNINKNNIPKQRSMSAVTLIEQQQINSENENTSWSNQMKKKYHPTRNKPKKIL